MFDAIVTLLNKLQSGAERDVVLDLRQPLTARQLSGKQGVTPSHSSAVLERLNQVGLVRCVNPYARASRLYYPTTIGRLFHDEIAAQLDRAALPPLQKLDWMLYGSLCYSHRSAVLKTLTREMTPSTIKRLACFNDPALAMSFTNTRDTTAI